jgi:hypothetical protein
MFDGRFGGKYIPGFERVLLFPLADGRYYSLSLVYFQYPIAPDSISVH